jgi:hypothetical protein
MYVNIKMSFDVIGTERVNGVCTDRKTKIHRIQSSSYFENRMRNGEERAIFINE